MSYNELIMLSSAKLKALAETTTPETRAIIADILEKRANGEKTASNEVTEATVRPLPPTDAEIKAKAEELRAKYKGCLCQVLPKNSDQWTDGIVLSIMEGLRSQTVFFSVKTVDNKRVVKTYDSPELKLTEEKGVACGPNDKRPYNQIKSEEWDPKQAIEKAMRHVGCLVACDAGIEGDKPGTLSLARVVSVVPNKRNRSILLRLRVPLSPTGDPAKFKLLHRAINDSMCFVSDEYTEEIRAKYTAKVQERRERENLDPSKRVIFCEENLKKAEAALLRAQEVLRIRQEQLSDAKNELLKTM